MQTWSWTTRTRTCSPSPHRSLWWGWQTAGLATESSCSSIPRRLGPPMTPCALRARRPEVSPSGTSWTKAGLPRRGRRSPCGWPRDWTSSWVFEKTTSRKWKEEEKEEISDSFPKVYLFLLILLLYLLLVLFDYVFKSTANKYMHRGGRFDNSPTLDIYIHSISVLIIKLYTCLQTHIQCIITKTRTTW